MYIKFSKEFDYCHTFGPRIQLINKPKNRGGVISVESKKSHLARYKIYNSSKSLRAGTLNIT